MDHGMVTRMQVDRYKQIIAQKETQIGTLRTQLTYTFEAVQHWQAREAKAHKEIARLQTMVNDYVESLKANLKLIHALRIPCDCEPPGSGEFCNGCCQVQALLLDDVAEFGPEAWENFREAFAEAVAKVREGHDHA
jgi:hypothetical protein